MSQTHNPSIEGTPNSRFRCLSVAAHVERVRAQRSIASLPRFSLSSKELGAWTMSRKQTRESIPSPDTDTQHQDAASRRVLRAGQRQRLDLQGTPDV